MVIHENLYFKEKREHETKCIARAYSGWSKGKKQGAKGLLILYGLARVYPTFLAGTLFYANRAPTRDAPTLNA